MGIEKAFDSVDYKFILAVLSKAGFGKKFVSWFEVLLNNQEPCVINSGNTTWYFSLLQGAHQVDPVSNNVFILCMKIFYELLTLSAKLLE